MFRPPMPTQPETEGASPTAATRRADELDARRCARERRPAMLRIDAVHLGGLCRPPNYADVSLTLLGICFTRGARAGNCAARLRRGILLDEKIERWAAAPNLTILTVERDETNWAVSLSGHDHAICRSVGFDRILGIVKSTDTPRPSSARHACRSPGSNDALALPK